MRSWWLRRGGRPSGAGGVEPRPGRRSTATTGRRLHRRRRLHRTVDGAADQGAGARRPTSCSSRRTSAAAARAGATAGSRCRSGITSRGSSAACGSAEALRLAQASCDAIAEIGRFCESTGSTPTTGTTAGCGRRRTRAARGVGQHGGGDRAPRRGSRSSRSSRAELAAPHRLAGAHRRRVRADLGDRAAGAARPRPGAGGARARRRACSRARRWWRSSARRRWSCARRAGGSPPIGSCWRLNAWAGSARAAPSVRGRLERHRDHRSGPGGAAAQRLARRGRASPTRG